MIPGQRVLNLNGHQAHYRVHVFLTMLFVVVMIFYAAFRGQRVVTQLPAVFRTTTAPKRLPVDFLNQMFTTALPDNTFELPELTVCPFHRNTTLRMAECQVSSATGRQNCGFTTRTVNLPFAANGGRGLRCLVVNSVRVNTSEDTLAMTLFVDRVPVNAANGVLVTASDSSSMIEASNIVSAGSFMNTILLVEKLFRINLDNKGETVYELKAIPVPLNTTDSNGKQISNAGGHIIKMEMRYPTLEVTYEKTFLPLDRNHWLGEVGGVAAILYFIYITVMKIIDFILLKHPKTSESGFARLEKEERLDLN